MIRLPADVRDAVMAHAASVDPEEACGLLATDGDGEVRTAYCLKNVERSRSRFTIDPDEHFRSLLHAERNGWSIGGVFHSHPRSPAVPSQTDIAGALDSDWVYLIVGAGKHGTEVRAWSISGGAADEIPIEVVGMVL